MKIVSDRASKKFLMDNMSKEFVLKTLQPALLKALEEYKEVPSLIPPRTVRDSNCTENTHLFMPCNGPSHLGVKVVTGGPHNNAKGISFVGPIVVLEPETGLTTGIVNAKTVTAFRTALATSFGMVKALDPNDPDLNILPEISAFGAGGQAKWHIVLALALYGLKKVNIVNRSIENANKFAKELKESFPDVEFIPHVLDEVRPETFAKTSIFFGCTPSTKPIILSSYLNKDPKYRKFIGLIGSYKPHMIELDLEYIKSHIKDHSKIVVDSKEHTLEEAGELIQGGITAGGLVEITDLATTDAKLLANEDGVVVLKVVGLSIMDLAIAKLLVSVGAAEIEVEDF